MSDIPSQVRGIDIFKLPLSTTEGFVLSRVDGMSNVDDIAMMCGLDALQVQSILQRLAQLGAVSWGGAQLPSPQQRQAQATRVSVRPPAMPVQETYSDAAASARGDRGDTPPVRSDRPVRAPSQPETVRPPPARPLPTPVAIYLAEGAQEAVVDTAPPDSQAPDSQRPTAMPPPVDAPPSTDSMPADDDVEIDVDRRRRILDAFARLDGQTHYEALGIPQDAPKADVRRAYFELSKQFHPDSLFGRRLGDYKAKMEAVFKHLTEAYDVLSKAKRRADYDEFLAATAATRRAHDVLARADREAAVIEQTIRASMTGMPAATATTPMPASEPPPPSPGPPPRSLVVPPPPGAPVGQPPSASLRPPGTPRIGSTDDNRRARAQEALRRRLDAATGRDSMPPPSRAPSAFPPAGGGSVPPSPASGPPRGSSIPPSDGRRQDALRGLARSLHDAHQRTATTSIEQHLSRARAAEASGDTVAAANFYRLAMAAAPHRTDIQQAHERVSRALEVHLADSYEKQAQYEERAGHWAEAGAAWLKVVKGRPDDQRALRSAAGCLLKGNVDLHAALKCALRFNELAGENAANLTLLARVYLAAGLKLNARRELEKAAKLDPSDELIKNLLKEAR